MCTLSLAGAASSQKRCPTVFSRYWRLAESLSWETANRQTLLLMPDILRLQQPSFKA
jgi:hypothetical protein